jgi:branched-chain amino acid transport system permease protein
MRRVALGLLCLLLLSLPWWIGSGYYVNIASQVLIWGIFALALNVLVGWAGLVSLGHAGLFGMAAYALAWLLAAGFSQLSSVLLALAFTMLISLIFGLLSLRAVGIGFLMITLALSQIFWGIAYRWIDLTNGDNGIIVRGRPEIFGLSLVTPGAFYFFSLLVFAVAVASLFVLDRSPYGASLRGTRDQARRMNSLGYNVWLTRLMAVLVSGFWSGVAGIMFVYYHQFVSPHVLALTTSAEVLLMVIAGGPATLLGPIVGSAIVVIMKNVASAYIERWNFVLGVIFVTIVMFMPEGLVPGARRLWGWWRTRGRGASEPERPPEP